MLLIAIIISAATEEHKVTDHRSQITEPQHKEEEEKNTNHSIAYINQLKNELLIQPIE